MDIVLLCKECGTTRTISHRDAQTLLDENEVRASAGHRPGCALTHTEAAVQEETWQNEGDVRVYSLAMPG